MNILLIGLGKIGVEYDFNQETSYSHRNSILKIPGKNIIYYMDYDNVKGSFYAKLDNTIFVDSFSKIVHPIDLAIISVPTNKHLEIFELLVNNIKPKKILLEKPAGSNATECNEILKISKDLNLKVYVNYMRNLLPSTQKIKNYINNADIKNFNVSINHTGSIRNNGLHFLSLICCIYNFDIQKLKISNNKDKFFKATSDEISIQINVINQIYPFFNISMSYEEGILIYEDFVNEKDSSWRIYELSTNKIKNIGKKSLHKKDEFKLGLDKAQEFILKSILDDSKTKNIESISLERAMLISNLIDKNKKI